MCCKILGVICQKFWEFRIIRRHRSRVHQSRPEKRRDLRHVSQPRARVNVSCSRASDRGSRGPQKRGGKGYFIEGIINFKISALPQHLNADKFHTVTKLLQTLDFGTMLPMRCASTMARSLRHILP